MIIFGTRLFGKVDTVPGLGFVATRFFHIDYVPLIPTECWLVFQHTGKTWRGVRVPMSAKSIMFAWMRTAAVAAIIGGMTHASYARACELGRHAKLNDRGMAALAVAYGQPPMTFGFEPLPVAPTPLAPRPVTALPLEDDDVAVEEIPLEELEASAAEDQQPVAAPPALALVQPRQEMRRHG